MKPVKFIFLATAFVAVALTFFFAYVDVEGMRLTLWEMRQLEVPHGYIILGAMVLPALFGVLALATQKLARWQAILGFVAYAIALAIAFLVFKKTDTSFGSHGTIAAKLMVLTLSAGLVAALAGAVKPERATA